MLDSLFLKTDRDTLVWTISMMGIALGLLVSAIWFDQKSLFVAMIGVVALYASRDVVATRSFPFFIIFILISLISNYYNVVLTTNMMVFYIFMSGYCLNGKPGFDDWIRYGLVTGVLLFFRADHFQGPLLQGLVDPFCIWLLTRKNRLRFLVLLIPVFFIVTNFYTGLYLVGLWDCLILLSFVLLLYGKYNRYYPRFFLFLMIPILILQYTQFSFS